MLDCIEIFAKKKKTLQLDFDAVKKLIAVLNDLVAKGNTVVVIEHNLDVIKSGELDHRISGPRAGTRAAGSWPRHALRKWPSLRGVIREVFEEDVRQGLNWNRMRKLGNRVCLSPRTSAQAVSKLCSTARAVN